MMGLKCASGHWRTGIQIGMPVAGMLWFTGAALSAPALPDINTNNIIVITNAAYGAKFDNSTDNTIAISNAIVAAAAGGTTNGAAGGTVEIPPGTNAYLCGPIVLLNNVNLQIDAGAILRMLPLGQYPGGTNTGTTFISGSNLHDIEISGSGAIDGQGAAWWPYPSAPRPRMISPSSCNRLLIQNVTLSNSPMFHIAISGSHSGNSTVQGVTIRAPSSAPNTDACDVSGTNILVQNCDISVGDDDFTCGGGTSGVLLTNNTYGNGHGISIGSYTDSGGVSNITVINCTINGAVNGIRIKSDDGRGGLVQNISYYNIGITNVHFPIQIYAYYLLTGTPSSISPSYAATQTVAAFNSTPVFRNITFSNINATSVSGYPVGIIWARTEMPATNIVFNKINVTGDRNFCLYNVSGAQFIDSKITVSASTTTFALFNAQVIVTNSSPLASLVTFDGLTTNGYANGFALYNAQASLKNTNVFDVGPLTIGGGKLTVSNNLTLFPPTTLNFVLGTNAATVSVVSNLTLGGTINITNGDGFTNGTCTLLTYMGGLKGSLPTLGKPAGFNYLYSLDTNTPGQVNLLVQSPPSPVFTAVTVSANGGFSFDVTNGPPGNSVYLLAATSLAQPPAQWTPVATNQFDGNGQSIFTNAFGPTYPQTFYLLELP
jgi:polygalacturonase